MNACVKCNVVRRFRWWDLVCAVCRPAAVEKADDRG